MGMKEMHLVQTPQTADLMSVSDSELEGFFAAAGLAVTVVAHCNAAGCAVCFAEASARAA